MVYFPVALSYTPREQDGTSVPSFPSSLPTRRWSILHMPKPVLCAICSHKIPYGTIHEDLLSHHPRFGRPHPGQQTIACACCGRYLHVACVEEAGTSIAWHHLWFSNMRMRAFIEEHQLMGQRIALCKKCHGELSDQIVGNYRALERFQRSWPVPWWGGKEVRYELAA